MREYCYESVAGGLVDLELLTRSALRYDVRCRAGYIAEFFPEPKSKRRFYVGCNDRYGKSILEEVVYETREREDANSVFTPEVSGGMLQRLFE